MVVKEGRPPRLWDDAGFVAKVRHYAELRGIPVRRLCREAGLAYRYLDLPAARGGRTIEGLLQLARRLDINVTDLIVTRNDANHVKIAASNDSARTDAR